MLAAIIQQGYTARGLSHWTLCDCVISIFFSDLSLISQFYLKLCESKMADIFVPTTKVPSTNHWGKTLLEDITTAFSKVTTIINKKITEGNIEITKSLESAKSDILRSVGEVERVANAAKLQANTNAQNIKILHSRFTKLEYEHYNVTQENKSLRASLLQYEPYSRRDNLIIIGITNVKDETDVQCKSAVRILSSSTS